ncbi:MAG: hypothetical protein WCY11_02510 [Novosphingobium sp.]
MSISTTTGAPAGPGAPGAPSSTTLTGADHSSGRIVSVGSALIALD